MHEDHEMAFRDGVCSILRLSLLNGNGKRVASGSLALTDVALAAHESPHSVASVELWHSLVLVVPSNGDEPGCGGASTDCELLLRLCFETDEHGRLNSRIYGVRGDVITNVGAAPGASCVARASHGGCEGGSGAHVRLVHHGTVARDSVWLTPSSSRLRLRSTRAG